MLQCSDIAAATAGKILERLSSINLIPFLIWESTMLRGYAMRACACGCTCMQVENRLKRRFTGHFECITIGNSGAVLLYRTFFAVRMRQNLRFVGMPRSVAIAIVYATCKISCLVFLHLSAKCRLYKIFVPYFLEYLMIM